LKIVREHISFEKPESEEKFKDSLFYKPMYIFKDSPRNSFAIHFKNLNDVGYWCDYYLNKKIFTWDGSSTYHRSELIQKLKKYNIPYKIKQKANKYGYIKWFNESIRNN